MVKSISLSDPAFDAIRGEKRDDESDVVLRLVEEAHSARRDPMHFVRSRGSRERVLSPSAHRDAIDETEVPD